MENIHSCQKSGNTGFVTMLNFQQERDFDESVITFSHEVAHNFGASHDDGFKVERE